MFVSMKENGPTLVALLHDSSLEKFSVLFLLYKNSLCQSLRGWIRWRTHASAMTNTDCVPCCLLGVVWLTLYRGQWPGYCWVWKAAFHPSSSEYWVLKSSRWMSGVTTSPTSPHQPDWGKVRVSSIHMYLCIMISWFPLPSCGHHAAVRAAGHQAWLVLNVRTMWQWVRV